MLPSASPFQLEEFERLRRKIRERLIEADVRTRYFARILEKPGLWRRALAAVGKGEPASQLASFRDRWRSLLERFELLWSQLSSEDSSEVDRRWRAVQRE